MALKKEYKEFIVIEFNFNITKNDGEEHLYNEDDFYFKLNNTKYNNII